MSAVSRDGALTPSERSLRRTLVVAGALVTAAIPTSWWLWQHAETAPPKAADVQPIAAPLPD
jgi:NADH:ubiquinone oxidoreductase subunit